MPLSLAYAIWSGVGTALTVLVGIVIWHDIFTVYSAIGIVLIIGGVILLNQGEKVKKWWKRVRSVKIGG